MALELPVEMPLQTSLVLRSKYACMMLVRSHLEYANSAWYPKRKSDIDKLECVQKRATKLILELSRISYIDRLKALNLPTLKYRRHRGDTIELFEIIKGIYDYTCFTF